MSHSGLQKFTVITLSIVAVGVVSRGPKVQIAALLTRMSMFVSGCLVRKSVIADLVVEGSLEARSMRMWCSVAFVLAARVVRDLLGWAWREMETRLWWEVRTCWARERPKPAEVPVMSQVGVGVDIVVMRLY